MRKSCAPSVLANKKQSKQGQEQKPQEKSEQKLEQKKELPVQKPEQQQQQRRRVGDILRLPNSKPSKLCETFEKVREARNAVWARQNSAFSATMSIKPTKATKIVKTASSSSSDSYTSSPYKRNYPNSDDDFESN